MAQRRKNRERKRAMLRVCERMMRVCRRRFSGTFIGAKRILYSSFD